MAMARKVFRSRLSQCTVPYHVPSHIVRYAFNRKNANIVIYRYEIDTLSLSDVSCNDVGSDETAVQSMAVTELDRKAGKIGNVHDHRKSADACAWLTYG
jgi:hypothetical protein